MSFSVKGEEEDFEYAGTPRGLFCQPRNLAQPALSADDRRPAALQPRAAPVLDGADEDTASRSHDFLARHRFSRAFVERLIVPQVSAVWSADPRQMHTFPVRFLAEFFANHGMLGFRDRPRWSTVSGRLGALRARRSRAVPRAHPPALARCELDRARSADARRVESSRRPGERASSASTRS